MWQCQSATNLPPKCHSNDSAVHNKHIEQGKKQMAQIKQALLPVMSAAFSVIFRINDNLSQRMAAAPITTALVAAITRTTLSWLHGFESQTRHLPLSQHLIRKKIIADEPAESSKYLVLKSWLLWNDMKLQYIIISMADTLRCHFLGPSCVSLVWHLQEWTWIIATISSVYYSLSILTNKSSAQSQ